MAGFGIKGFAASALIWLSACVSQGAVIYVTSIKAGHLVGQCSLREAVFSANLDNNIAIDSYNSDGSANYITTDCLPGNGDDVIVLPTGANLIIIQPGVVLSSAYGPAVFPTITTNITIQGNGAQLSGVPTGGRAFNVAEGGSLTLMDITLFGFSVQGGHGWFGGGGGLGAGGAIYVEGSNGGAHLTAIRCTFTSNQVAGGEGGDGYAAGLFHLGGGGGLSGDSGGIGVDLTVSGLGGGGSIGMGGLGQPAYGSDFGGGGGGGNLFAGSVGALGYVGGAGGIFCGGHGGGHQQSGQDGTCPGGGGGGGGVGDPSGSSIGPNGGNGNYGGGGGGAGVGDTTGLGNGGSGGFGGGGGSGVSGGAGGYGAGGGQTITFALTTGPLPGGPGGRFGGQGGQLSGGGGGGALGGAIFSHLGTVLIRNSTFFENFVTGGPIGLIGLHCTLYPYDCSTYAAPGPAEGGAIFAVDGSLTVQNSTIAGNVDYYGEGAGIVVDVEPGQTAQFTLDNTIISNGGSRECFYTPGVTAQGAGNLIVNNGGCPGVVSSSDPQLGPLQTNGGITPTMAITKSSPAFDAGDPTTSLSEDQRQVYRPQAAGFDIGAYELCVASSPILPVFCTGPTITEDTYPLTIAASPATGGTTYPPPGIDKVPAGSVVFLSALPTPGNYFLGWTGPVTDASNPLTTMIMNQPQTVTAQFSNLTTTMAGNITAKSGPSNARVWTLSLSDNGPAGAAAVQVPSLTLVQTAGATCTPVMNTVLPLAFSAIPAGEASTANVTIDFSPCAAAARFTATFTYTANYGSVSGSVVRTNQFQ
jgi:Divergent InlB B-repeat domain